MYYILCTSSLKTFFDRPHSCKQGHKDCKACSCLQCHCCRNDAQCTYNHMIEYVTASNTSEVVCWHKPFVIASGWAHNLHHTITTCEASWRNTPHSICLSFAKRCEEHIVACGQHNLSKTQNASSAAGCGAADSVYQTLQLVCSKLLTTILMSYTV
jgi:hypothetical protein